MSGAAGKGMTITEARQQVRAFTNELNVFNRVAATNTLTLQDTFVLMRNLGLPSDMQKAIMMMQTGIATANALRVTMRLLEIELGPWGKALLAVGAVIATVAFQEVMVRRPTY